MMDTIMYRLAATAAFCLRLIIRASLKRAIAVFTLLCFVVTLIPVEGISSQPVREGMQTQGRTGRGFYPSRLPGGRITEAFWNGGPRVVINIQDLHCHAEVQRNIARLLSSLGDRYTIKGVYVEGAVGNVDVSWIDAIRDDAVRRAAVEAFLGSGKLTGAEYYAMTAGGAAPLLGLEDEDIYLRNLVRLKQIRELYPEQQGRLAVLRRQLSAVEQRYFGSSALRFEGTIARYRAGKLPVLKYYGILAQLASENNITSAGNTLRQYVALSSLRKSIDHKAIGRQLQSLLNELKREMPYAEYRLLSAAANDPGRKEEWLETCARAGGRVIEHDPAGYAELGRYFEFIKRSGGINPVELVRDEGRVTRELRLHLAASGVAREVAFLACFIDSLDEYLNNRASAEEHDYFARNYAEFRRLWEKYSSSEALVALEPSLALLGEFYGANIERNRRFLNNLSDVASGQRKRALFVSEADQAAQVVAALQDGTEAVVVVTGGFHTEGMARLLRENGISYMIITPDVTSGPAEAELIYDELARLQGSLLSQTIQVLVGWQGLSYAASAQEYLAVAAEKIDAPFLSGLIQGGLSRQEIEAAVNEMLAGVQERYGKATRPGKAPLPGAVRFTLERSGEGVYEYALSWAGSEGGVLRRFRAERDGRVTALQETASRGISADEAFAELERGVVAALGRYSNVHRGAGQHSLISTELYEHAREIFLAYWGLDDGEYTVVFGTRRSSERIKRRLRPEALVRELASGDIGLPLGVHALAVHKADLPEGMPEQTGGGTVKLVSKQFIVWADAPERFEAGTPDIAGVIAFAKALEIIRYCGDPSIFMDKQSGIDAVRMLNDDALPGLAGTELLAELRKQLIGAGAQVPTSDGERSYVNFDNGASTPTFWPVWQTVLAALRQPGSSSRGVIDEVRRIAARFFNAPQEIYEHIFAANTTEALNILAESLAREAGKDTVVLNTIMEHNSNELPWRRVQGVTLERMDVSDTGFINLRVLERTLRAYNVAIEHGNKRIRLVAVSGASNVLGSQNDIAEISRLAHRYGARVLIDAAQLTAHRRIDMAGAGIDFLAYSGHKVYAPFGSGGLIIRRDALRFGTRELEAIKASGEENVAGIAALGKALSLLERIGMDVIEQEERSLTRRALEGLSGIEGVEVYGVKDPADPKFVRKGGVVIFSVVDIPHNIVGKLLAEQGGIGVRNGCFCAHLLVKRLLRINIARDILANAGLLVMPRFVSPMLPGFVRISFGIENTADEVDHFIEALQRVRSVRVSRFDKVLALFKNGAPLVPQSEEQEKIRSLADETVQEVYSFPGREEPVADVQNTTSASGSWLHESMFKKPVLKKAAAFYRMKLAWIVETPMALLVEAAVLLFLLPGLPPLAALAAGPLSAAAAFWLPHLVQGRQVYASGAVKEMTAETFKTGVLLSSLFVPGLPVLGVLAFGVLAGGLYMVGVMLRHRELNAPVLHQGEGDVEVAVASEKNIPAHPDRAAARLLGSIRFSDGISEEDRDGIQVTLSNVLSGMAVSDRRELASLREQLLSAGSVEVLYDPWNYDTGIALAGAARGKGRPVLKITLAYPRVTEERLTLQLVRDLLPGVGEIEAYNLAALVAYQPRERVLTKRAVQVQRDESLAEWFKSFDPLEKLMTADEYREFERLKNSLFTLSLSIDAVKRENKKVLREYSDRLRSLGEERQQLLDAIGERLRRMPQPLVKPEDKGSFERALSGRVDPSHPLLSVPIAGASAQDEERVRRVLRERVAPVVPAEHAALLGSIEIVTADYGGEVPFFHPGKIRLVLPPAGDNRYLRAYFDRLIARRIVHEMGHVVHRRAPGAWKAWREQAPFPKGYTLIGKGLPLLYSLFLVPSLIYAFPLWQFIPFGHLLSSLVYPVAIYILLVKGVFQQRVLMPIYREQVKNGAPFVSAYALVSRYEDFAESYLQYALDHDDFVAKVRADRSGVLLTKYRSMEALFNGDTPLEEGSGRVRPGRLLSRKDDRDEMAETLRSLPEFDDIGTAVEHAAGPSQLLLGAPAQDMVRSWFPVSRKHPALTGRRYFLFSSDPEADRGRLVRIARQGLPAIGIAAAGRREFDPDDQRNLTDDRLPGWEGGSRVSLPLTSADGTTINVLLDLWAEVLPIGRGRALQIYYRPAREYLLTEEQRALLAARAPLAVARWLGDGSVVKGIPGGERGTLPSIIVADDPLSHPEAVEDCFRSDATFDDACFVFLRRREQKRTYDWQAVVRRFFAAEMPVETDVRRELQLLGSLVREDGNGDLWMAGGIPVSERIDASAYAARPEELTRLLREHGRMKVGVFVLASLLEVMEKAEPAVRKRWERELERILAFANAGTIKIVVEITAARPADIEGRQEELVALLARRNGCHGYRVNLEAGAAGDSGSWAKALRSLRTATDRVHPDTLASIVVPGEEQAPLRDAGARMGFVEVVRYRPGERPLEPPKGAWLEMCLDGCTFSGREAASVREELQGLFRSRESSIVGIDAGMMVAAQERFDDLLQFAEYFAQLVRERLRMLEQDPRRQYERMRLKALKAERGALPQFTDGQARSVLLFLLRLGNEGMSAGLEEELRRTLSGLQWEGSPILYLQLVRTLDQWRYATEDGERECAARAAGGLLRGLLEREVVRHPVAGGVTFNDPRFREMYGWSLVEGLLRCGKPELLAGTPLRLYDALAALATELPGPEITELLARAREMNEDSFARNGETAGGVQARAGAMANLLRAALEREGSQALPGVLAELIRVLPFARDERLSIEQAGSDGLRMLPSVMKAISGAA